MAHDENKSTPLGQYKCPRIALEGGNEADHTVTLDSGITYECTCGEVFEWESQTVWRRIAATEE